MPTYEYECNRCGHHFELFQNMSDSPRKRCVKCRGAVRRLLGAGAGILFKGSGFYQTDYRSRNYTEASKKDKPSAESTSAKTKPADAKAKSAATAKTKTKA